MRRPIPPTGSPVWWVVRRFFLATYPLVNVTYVTVRLQAGQDCPLATIRDN